jgi:hypothetical protein
MGVSKQEMHIGLHKIEMILVTRRLAETGLQ